VEDRIREGKAAGLRNFPCHGWEKNNAWLEAVLAAAARSACLSEHCPGAAEW
jgi:hypothetical protein